MQNPWKEAADEARSDHDEKVVLLRRALAHLPIRIDESGELRRVDDERIPPRQATAEEKALYLLAQRAAEIWGVRLGCRGRHGQIKVSALR